ncbi:MAG: hypothetical protein M3312_08710 [Actinomycetota bacterium]|nr:hypothetical protein [Actinomycetota bacterium]
MSLYREAGRASGRSLAAVALAALAIGSAAGFPLGRATCKQATLRASVAAVRREARPALGELELVAIEYADASRRDGESEYEAARAHVERARKAFAETRGDLSVLAPVETGRAASELDALAALVARRAPAARVEERAESAARAIRSAARIDAGEPGREEMP